MGFQRILERILRVDYVIPPDKPVSAECCDLLARVLVADPAARATVPEIMRHPWFSAGLPSDASAMNDECLAMRPHDHPGYQTVEEIKAIVAEAASAPGAAAAAAAADEAIIEDVIVDGDLGRAPRSAAMSGG